MSSPIVATTVADMVKLRSALPLGSILGFVPTMGCLHAGHISLIERAKKECTTVVVSIFVNPKQFGPNEDFDRYPRTFQADLALLSKAGVDIVFHPSVDEMYPHGFGTFVSVDEVGNHSLEGQSRPGFFRGVATVVAKLFNIIGPAKSYFGQKDAIQCIVIRQMVRDLNFTTAVVICETTRELDGLAMSSRNTYLSSEDRKKASTIFAALTAGQSVYLAGQLSCAAIVHAVENVLKTEPAFMIQYISLVDMGSANELSRDANVQPSVGAILSLALRLGATRLIDNVILPANASSH